MTQILLRTEVLDKIKTDGELFGKIADVLDIIPASLPRLLYCNHQKLTQASVLKVLRDHLQVTNDSDLLTPEMEAA